MYMPAPTDPKKATYMFTEDIKFFQKIVLFHPSNKKLFLSLKRSPNAPNRPNCWDFPGGNIGFGENHEASLKREVIEETGLEFSDCKPVQVVTNFEKDIYYIFIGYIGIASSEEIVLNPEEHKEYKWVRKEDFMTLESATYLQEFVSKI